MNPCRTFTFRDPQPPHVVAHVLEDRLKVILQPVRDGTSLAFAGVAIVVGMPYHLRLRFEGAFPHTNCYGLTIEADLTSASSKNEDYFRKSAESWFDYWTSGFAPAPSPLPGEGSTDRYRALCEQVFADRARLGDVQAVQRALLDGLRGGKRLSTAHKEGGTIIQWRAGRFESADYGESSDQQTFDSDEALLAYVRRFFHWTVTSAFPKGGPTELEAWTLILRMLHD